MNKIHELLPCPFCGGTADFRDDGHIGYAYCIHCLARTDDYYIWRDDNWEEEAALEWNTRTCPECGKNQKSIKALLMNSEKLILVMQTAYVEMCNTGTDNAMLWIENTLDNIGSIPDVRKRTSEEFFDEELAKLESSRRNEQ